MVRWVVQGSRLMGLGRLFRVTLTGFGQSCLSEGACVPSQSLSPQRMTLCRNDWPFLATYPYLSTLPSCQSTLPRADGQLCFLFISAADEDILAKGKQSIKGQALGNQNSENEILLESDDDTLSSVDEKDLENLAGKFSACAAVSASSGPISI